MGGSGYSILVNYEALQLKYRSISPPPQPFFYIKYRRYGLLLVSFIESEALLGGNTAFPLPPLVSRPKCRIKKIPRFVALLRPSFALEWTQKMI